MADDVARFYDDLANHYHLLLEDWEQSLHWQAELLERVMADALGPGPKRVLDAACGIGTQALGLALRGHEVSGSDLSPSAVARAKREATARGLKLFFTAADMRNLSGYHAGPFDSVCIMDNSLVHLRGDEDLLATLGEAHGLLRPGGLFIASLRDYDSLTQSHPRASEPRVFDGPEGRRVVFQVWDWRKDGTGYRVQQYLLLQDQRDGPVREALHFATDSWCIGRERLASLMERAGFERFAWLRPEDSGYYQPIALARRAADP